MILVTACKLILPSYGSNTLPQYKYASRMKRIKCTNPDQPEDNSALFSFHSQVLCYLGCFHFQESREGPRIDRSALAR